MNVQRVNVFSARNMVNSADKLSKVNFTSDLLKSDAKDCFLTKHMSGSDGPVEVYGGFVC